MKIRSAIAVLPALLATGCTTRQAPVVAAPRAQLPARYLTCADAPSGAGVSTDADVAGYVLDQRTALEDCKSKLGALAETRH